MRGCVDPWEKSVIVPGLSGFLKRAQDSIFSHGGAALISEPQPISGKRMWSGFHIVRSGVHTVDHRYCSRVLRAVEILKPPSSDNDDTQRWNRYAKYSVPTSSKLKQPIFWRSSSFYRSVSRTKVSHS